MKLSYLTPQAGANELNDAFHKASPGDGIVYFRGLHVAKEKGGQLEVASYAYRLFSTGKAILVRKPLAPAGTPKRQFDYICVKRKTQA